MVLERARLDRLTSRAGIFGLAGFAIVAVASKLDYGIITGVSLVGLMATLGSFTNYATERGLWMLALLFGVLLAATQGLIAFGQASDLLNGRSAEWPVAVDLAVASRFWWLQGRVLWSVVFYNRLLTRES
jgi:hypothetical protein